MGAWVEPMRRVLAQYLTPREIAKVRKVAKRLHAEQDAGAAFTAEQVFARLLTDGLKLAQDEAERIAKKAVSEPMPEHLKAKIKKAMD